ncbi:glycoside hydrolase family 27 protein [Paenibacillus sp. S28]|uniref:glycoside hydrolase family 27 protein n=1 Tax=Paenibacillus sp. S28 TaxID=2767463 RepID=UPI00190951F1|nr:glycoside hydrolase family 27 protein [Paenibacillus sp. S28]MBJ9992327.1 glycoside hydrolase family 27 protein [Paenibacillus sp. S28]
MSAIRTIAGLDKGTLPRLTPRPPLGWNSFDCYGCAAPEDALLRNAEAMAKLLKPAGYEYFVVDNGWFAEYGLAEGSRYPTVRHANDVNLDEYGRLQPSQCYFPNGMQQLIDRVHELGLKFGIHVMRGIPRKAVALNLPVYGTPYRAADIAELEDTCVWCPYNYGVNMDHPGAQPFYDSWIHMLADWGVDFIKADDITGHPREIKAIVKAIHTSGRDIVLSLSPGGQTKSENMEVYRQANLLRTTRDIWDNRSDLDKAFQAWHAFNEFRLEGFWLDLDMIPFGHLQLWKPRADGASYEENAAEEQLSGKGHERMSGLSTNQKLSFITIRALAASPLFMGGDLPTSDAYSLSLITNPDMLACNQNGIMGFRVHAEEGLEVWKSPSRSDATEGWIGIFNRTTEKWNARLTLGQLGLNESGEPKLRSIWPTPSFWLQNGVLTSDLEGDGVLFLHFKE